MLYRTLQSKEISNSAVSSNIAQLRMLQSVITQVMYPVIIYTADRQPDSHAAPDGCYNTATKKFLAEKFLDCMSAGCGAVIIYIAYCRPIKAYLLVLGL